MKSSVLFFTSLIFVAIAFASDPELLIGDQTTNTPAIRYDLILGTSLPKDPANCGGLGSFNLQKYPIVGSRLFFHNTTSTILLLRAFVTLDQDVSRGGVNERWVSPTNTSSVRLLKDENLGLSVNIHGTSTLVLHPGDTVEATVPAPLSVVDSETTLTFQCQSLVAFKKRPKFSYGTMSVFQSSN